MTLDPSGDGAASAPSFALPPLPGPLTNREAGAVFLCYHSVSEEGPAFLSLPPDTFEHQLATLRRLGYGPGTPAALAALAAGERPARPLAFLTFDDGFRDNFTHAFPLLEAYGFTAQVFLLPPLVDEGAPLAWPEVEERASRHPDVMRSMTWSMVETMAAAGIEFGSHTCRHPRLTDLDDDHLRQELLDSRRAIAERLGRCDTLAYPFGAWSPRVAAAAADAGYSFAFSLPYGSPGVGPQTVATRLSIPRVPVDHRDAGVRFRLKLTPPGRRLLMSPSKERAQSLPAAVRRAALSARERARSLVRALASRSRRSQEGGRKRILLVCSPGGHLLQMLSLEPAWRDFERAWVTLPGADVDHLLQEERVTIAHGPTNRSLVNLARNLPLAWRTIRDRDPDVILSTGAGPAVPFFLAGKLLRRRLVYVESLTRLESLSVSGRLVYPLADAFFVQWPQLARGKARYAGNIL